jgi:glycosyltransferase involved in cell wall biosynthesis
VTRIAFIDYFPTHYRRSLYEELARRADVDFFFFSDERERWWNPNIPHANHGDYHRVDLPRYRVAGQSVMPGIARRILGGKYDAVIKNSNGKVMLPLIYASAKARGIPFVLWQGMWMHPRTHLHTVSKPLLEGIYRGAGAIVCYGEHVRQFILQTRGVDPDKLFVAGQAVDGARFEAVAGVWNGGAAEVLYVGQFEEVKGVRYLVEAFDRMNDTEARLRLIGGGSQESWVRDRAQRSGQLELAGFRSQDELPAEFARARCLVLPSVTTEIDRETWGMVVNEAFHAGVPVVATDAVGAAAGGLVRDQRNGFVVPERDPEALSRAIRRLIEDPELARRMGDAGHEDVAAFTHERMANAFLAAVDHGLARTNGHCS